MSTSFLTSLSEQEFKDFLKSAIRETLSEELKQLGQALPDTLGIKEAANFLKLKITTLYEKTSRKLIPHFKKGNKLYFLKAELEEWIKKGKVKTQGEIEGDAATYLLTGKEKNSGKNKSMFNKKNQPNEKN
jgi:excisionase family DNA binding protein